jgi:hypothetical protein
MKKVIKEYLLSKQFTLLETTSDVTGYNPSTKFVVDYNEKNVTVIAYETTKDVRFVGNIHNLQQLKLILELTNYK